MGLLDFDSPDTRLGLGLLAAASARSDGAGFGQRLAEAVGSVDQWKQQQQMAKMQELQMQDYMARVAEAKAQREQQALDQQAVRGALAGGKLDPRMFLQGNPQVSLGALEQAMKYNSMINPEPKERTLSPGQVVFQGDKQILSVPKEATSPAAIQEYEYAKKQGYGGSYLDFQVAQKRAGASNINLGDNLGLKPKDRFEMEGTLRNNFEKQTADDYSIVSTASDIGNILKQGGALKDQAAIYKFAKALDPQGAVREADYAAIVRTAGGLEYVTNLVNKALTGEQLSARQRQEMTSLSNSMANIAKQRIAKVQQRTSANAKMYNLLPENIFSGFDTNAKTADDPLNIRR